VRNLEVRLHGFSGDRTAGDGLRIISCTGRHAPRDHDENTQGLWWGTVVEVKESYGGDAYRAIYTVRFAEAVYILHAFQKKSKTGVKTPKVDVNLIEKRLKDLIKERERRL